MKWLASVSEPVDGGGSYSVVLLRGNVRGATIGPAVIRHTYRAVDTSPSATVSGLTIKGLSAEGRGGCIRTHGEDILIRNARCAMVGGSQSGNVNMPFGLQITSGSNVRVEDSRFDGFQWQANPSRYWIAEGISVEWGVAGLSFRNVSADQNTDAGFDIKPFAKLDGVSAAGNCRNFRFWSGAEAGTLISGGTVKRGGISSCSPIWLNGSAGGSRPRLHIAKFVVRMSRPGPVIVVENGAADIQLDQCDIQAPLGSTLVRFRSAPGGVMLGPGCKV